MSIDADLQAFRGHLGDELGIDIPLVVRLSDASFADQALVVWPWHLEDIVLRETLPVRPGPGERAPSAVPLPRARLRILVVGDDLDLLFRVRAVLHRTPVLQVGERRLRLHASPLAVEQACSLFRASGAPMQAAIGVTLEQA